MTDDSDVGVCLGIPKASLQGRENTTYNPSEVSKELGNGISESLHLVQCDAQILFMRSCNTEGICWTDICYKCRNDNESIMPGIIRPGGISCPQ